MIRTVFDATIRRGLQVFLLTFLFLSPLVLARSVGIAEGVHAEIGDNGEITPENQGHVANAGFIVGNMEVLVVDTGASFLAGTELLERIAKITTTPIESAVLTHPTQEFIFGAAAFQQHGITVIAHREGSALMQQRCENCLKNLHKLLGDAAMKDTVVVKPDQLLDGSIVLDLGDRKVDLLYSGWASTPGDLAVFDRRTGSLFAGGLVTAERIPNLRDGHAEGWIKTLTALRKLPIRRIVPGFGPVGGPEEIDHMLDYLRQLDRAVRKRYRDGASLIETMQSVELPAFKHWRGYDSTHPQNVLYVYRQLEDADFR